MSCSPTARFAFTSTRLWLPLDSSSTGPRRPKRLKLPWSKTLSASLWAQAECSSKNKGRNAASQATPGGAPGGEVVINYELLCEKTKKEVKKLLTLVRKAAASAGQTAVADKQHKEAVRQGLRVIQDAADNAEDSLENVVFDEGGHLGLKALLERLQESYAAFLALLERCCPKALPKAKAKAKAEAKAEAAEDDEAKVPPEGAAAGPPPAAAPAAPPAAPDAGH